MSEEIFWRMVQSIATVVGVAMTIAIAVLLYLERQERNRELLRRERFERHALAWKYQQELNEKALTVKGWLEEFEGIVYGVEPEEINLPAAKKRFMLFIRLNILQDLWMERQEDLIDEGEFKARATTYLRLIKRQESLVDHLLTERGYIVAFGATIRSLLKDVEPPNPPEDLRVPHTARKALGT